ncbi:hypothetical protein BGW36DRAFT_367322 [Talaromyces proteolyticus]|uniref:Uncharacterized protein n=1 Tax=Talaromyces proteolyticus TaxID=1131652 RepID=A0AAD4L297_9EURO|nr:uncharacterized protein BGW36DRAFT_367322 [Talaromyces proteolyticus]KAH8705300.1 hypothetical protein BGW36DRAFT_367322 [Talaromyces proteolyticus]
MVIISRFSPALRAISTVRAGLRNVVIAFPRHAASARRLYASQANPGGQKSSEIPWLVGSIAVTVPAAFYVLNSGPQGKEHEVESHEPVANEEENVEKEKGEDEQDEGKEENPSDAGDGAAPSEQDLPDADKKPESPGGKSGSQPAKQQDDSGAETRNPHLEDPGKSKKAGGGVETGKVKGTVSSERPKKQG